VSRPIGCREAVRHLWAYLDRSLECVDHEALKAHLAWCLRCCGELDFARELQGLLRDQAAVDPPPEARDRLERFIDQLGAGTEP
jgi:mycothiol system anti-sigma-R factor